MPAKLINDEETWDKFVDNNPHGTLFHKWKFLKIMEKYSGYTLYPYGIYRSNELVCVIPLFFRHEKGLRVVASPPRQSILYVPYLGYLMSPVYDTLKQHKKEYFLDEVFDDMDAAISGLAPNYVTIIPVPVSQDLRPFIWSGYSIDLGYTYVMDLEQTEEELWNNLTKSCRKSIKDWEGGSLTIKQVKDADLFFQILRDNLAAEGRTFFHSQSPEYLKEIMETFPDNVKMHSMMEGEALRKISVTVEYHGRMILWMAGKPDEKDSSGEYYNWEIIKDARRRGIRKVENWGTGQRRLCRYKSKFNPALESTCAIHKMDNLGKLANLTYVGISSLPLLSSLLQL